MDDKYIIITSIFKPTEAVERFAELEDFKLVVVGDKKSPPDWAHDNVIYLSPEKQAELGYKIFDLLPWNHYCRKMLGYLYAIQQGASIIVDTDDDNIPMKSWTTPNFKGVYNTVSDVDYYNVYQDFTSHKVWPRGYPLDLITNNSEATIGDKTTSNIGVWQGLADEDPDVDAIYRLLDDTPIYFKDNEPVVLKEGTVCPFNSQNTFFIKELFPLLYLPSFVTFRFTDILRGLIAQPLMWQEGYTLGFGPATVVQKRNPHDYMKDFESEVPVYLHTKRVVEIAKDSRDPQVDLGDNLLRVYKALQAESIVNDNEVKLLEAWIEDIKSLQAAK